MFSIFLKTKYELFLDFLVSEFLEYTAINFFFTNELYTFYYQLWFTFSAIILRPASFNI